MDGRTLVLHESADILRSLEIPDFDDIVCSQSRWGDAAAVLIYETWAGKMKIGFNVHSSSKDASGEEADTVP